MGDGGATKTMIVAFALGFVLGLLLMGLLVVGWLVRIGRLR